MKNLLGREMSPEREEVINRLMKKAPHHVFHPVEKEMAAVQKDCAFAYDMARSLYAEKLGTPNWRRHLAIEWQMYARKRSEELRMLRMRLDIHVGMDKKHE